MTNKGLSFDSKAGKFVIYKMSPSILSRVRGKIFIRWHAIMTVCDGKLIAIVFLVSAMSFIMLQLFPLPPIDGDSFFFFLERTSPQSFTIMSSVGSRKDALMLDDTRRRRRREIDSNVWQLRPRCVLRWHFLTLQDLLSAVKFDTFRIKISST